ncbi:MAG TPA: discoidin domain-containing protein [Verrucomicrobiae bacterium]|nr:discoidin domain-containing protein [Verrucomicrobiae bacterium]
MRIYLRILVLLGTIMCGLTVHADEDNPVFKSLKYGIFVHHAWGGTAYALTKNPDLSVPKSIDEVADSFDIPRFVRDLQAADCEYISFTIWHANMNPMFPCAAMNKWRGPGHAAKRDVLGELIKEMKPTGIKLFLYVHPSDGMDMTTEDQDKLGWNELPDVSPQNQGVTWKPGTYIKWNNFINDVFDEMCAKYGKDISGYWVDGGWGRVDKKRLQETVWKYNPKAEFVSGMDNSGWCNQFNQMIPPDPAHGIPAATPQNVDTWPAFISNVNLIQGGSWWSTGGTAKMPPEAMLRYTVLEASANIDGGGTGWAADPYTDGTWEPNVREYFHMLGQLIRPIHESIRNTRPSNSYVTKEGSRIATLPYGVVAVTSADGQFEYLHVLRAPTGRDSGNRQAYVNTLELPPPADFKKFTKAVMLRSGREANLVQDDKGVRIGVPWQDAWDPLDTVIKLSVDVGTGCLSQGKPVTMSGPETPGWPMKNAVDGNKLTGWSSEAVDNGGQPWVMIDLEKSAQVSQVHLYPRIQDKTIGYNFPTDFEISVSADGKNFTKALAVTGYKVTSPRAYKTDYVWDPTLNDYKKAVAGQETEDLSLSGSGRKTPEDYPQYFVLPEGTQGRYVKITATKLKNENENRMQFTEVEIFGTLK